MWRAIAIAAIVLILSQSLNSVLGIASFGKIFRESLVSYFRIIANDIKRKVETAVNFGKPLEKFYGIEFILAPHVGKDGLIKAIYIGDPDGKVLYGTDKDAVGKDLGLVPRPNFTKRAGRKPDASEKDEAAFQTVAKGGFYYVTLPIFRNEREWVGNVYVVFEDAIIAEELRPMAWQSFRYLAAVTSVALALMAVALYFAHRFRGEKTSKRRFSIAPKVKTFMLIAAVLTASLSSYTWLSNGYFQRTCIRMADQRMEVLSILVKEEIERILKMGIPIDRLRKMDVLLNDIVKNVPECSGIKILDTRKMVQYLADGRRMSSVYDEDFRSERVLVAQNAVTTKLEGKKGVEGFAVFSIDTNFVQRQTYNLTLDSLTIILVSLLLAFEMLFFSYVYTIDTKKLGERFGGPDESKCMDRRKIDHRRQVAKLCILRSMAFIFFFCEYVPLAFMPLFIKHLYEKNPVFLFGLSKQTVLSLPISSYMLGVSVFVLVAGYFSERLSLIRSFTLFGILLFVGSALSAFAQDVLQLIVFRFLSGAGYGGVLVSGITMIIENTDEKDRTTGFGAWLNGSATATICAVPVGSVFCYYLGYKTALLFAAAAAAAFVVFVHYVARRLHFSWMFTPKPDSQITTAETESAPEQGPEPVGKLALAVSVFKDRDVFAALVFASIPVQIAIIGFLFFGFPLYLDSVGISQSNIGRFITVYGLANILFNPWVSRWADRLKNERIFMIVGNLVVGVVLISFTFATDAAMLLVVIAAVGAGSALVTSTTSSYVTLSRGASRIGASRLSSLFKTFQKLGTVIGLLLIGLLIGFYGYIPAMTAIGAMILFFLLLFIFFSRRLRGI